MARPSQDILQRIEVLLRTGRQQESRLLLLEYIQSNPASVEAWWLLSQVVSDPEQQADCLKRILRLDPDHAPALQRLATLNDPTGGTSASPAALFQEEPEPASSFTAFSFPTQDDEPELLPPPAFPAATPEPPSRSTQKVKQKSHWLEMFLAALLTVILVMAAFFLWNRHLGQVAAENALHLQETQAIALVLTQLPTSTASSTATLTPIQTDTPLTGSTPTFDKRFSPTAPAADQFRPSAGFYAPAFNLKDVKTARWIKPGQFAGRPVLLYFCDTTSAACRDEQNTLKSVQQKYAGQDLVILAVVSGESSATVELYQKSEQLAYPLLVDLDGSVKTLYQVESLPAFFFIEPTGRILSVEIGLLSYPDLVKQIGAILP